jgi:hypothetical protein
MERLEAAEVKERAPRLAKARREMIEAEEDLRALDRRQAARRARAQARLAAADEDVRRLRGASAAVQPPDRRLADLEEKWDLLIRELTELRREIRRREEGTPPR